MQIKLCKIKICNDVSKIIIQYIFIIIWNYKLAHSFYDCTKLNTLNCRVQEKKLSKNKSYSQKCQWQRICFTFELIKCVKCLQFIENKHHNLNHCFFGMKTCDFLEHKEYGLWDFLENDTILLEVSCVQISEYKSGRNTVKYVHS